MFPARSARPLWNLKRRHSQDPGENQTGKKALAENCAQERDLGPRASLLLKGQGVLDVHQKPSGPSTVNT